MKPCFLPVVGRWASRGRRALGAALGLWCLGVAGATASGVQIVELPILAAERRAGFTSLSAEVTGVRFANELRGDLSLTNAVAHNGSGVAIGDVDGDGWPDLYFCNLQGPNRLYRNLGGWRFEEVSLGEAACGGQLSTGAVLVDVDGDGDLDLLVNGIAAGTRLFRNDGRGGWAEVADSGLSRTASGTSLALADVDGDGDLDLYCTHYIDIMHLADPTTRFALAREEGRWRVTRVNGEPATRPYWKDRFEALADGRVRELPEVDGFYRNEGGGRFRAIQGEPGVFQAADGTPVGPFRDWGLSVMFRDVNGDGAPDLFVCNDNASPDRLWLNTGRGTFREPPAYTFRHTSRSSMALDFADVDRDGHDDLLVLDMLARDPGRRMRQLARDLPDLAALEREEEVPRFNRNMLYLGRADGTFAEVALQAGVAATDWSWCPAFLDVDLDGYEDLLVTNGFEFDVMDQDSLDRIRGMKMTFEQRKRFRQFHPEWPTANHAFRNRGDGTFELVSEAWGFQQAGVSCGMALGDLDQDGDLDVVVNNLNGVAGLYRNEATAPRIAVRLEGLPPNTAGIGARLILRGGPVPQSQEMMAGGRYLSGDQAMRVFAAEKPAGEPLELEVRWRNGDVTRAAVRPNAICVVRQAASAGAAAARGIGKREGQEPWLADVSPMLNHRHVEDPFDDGARQPLVPRRLSRLGPGLAWMDVDGDGWEDLVVPAARGGRLAVLLNQGGRGFREVLAEEVAANDQGAIVGWVDGRGARRLLVAQSNYELGQERPAAVLAYAWAEAAGPALRPLPALDVGGGSPGPLALADVDGDGDLDLLVGGRFRPGRYPEAVPSAVWLQEGGEWRREEASGEALGKVGMVSGAVFGDWDGDGQPDLALACDWGPVRLFRGEGGRWVRWNPAVTMEVASGSPGGATTTLEELTGCWSSVALGDFDGDGRLDLAVGNWGRNSLYELQGPGAVRLFHADTDGDGVEEVVEAWRVGEQWLPVRTRPWMARGFPDLPQRIPTHEAYGRATVAEVFGVPWDRLRSVEAKFFESAVFLNRGTHLVCRPLPPAAQRAPVFGLGVGDLDGDGVEDLFLAQNFFGSGSDLTREDGGRGLWLRGRGDGTFEAVESGLVMYGEQRGLALADYDRDGRVDLAIAQNDGTTRLYRNARGQPGVRVRLEGPPGNPSAVGAMVRLRYESGGWGPMRAVLAGGGYWSQDGAVPVLGVGGPVAGVWVRWPGGREQMVRWAPGQTEVRARFNEESVP